MKKTLDVLDVAQVARAICDLTRSFMETGVRLDAVDGMYVVVAGKETPLFANWVEDEEGEMSLVVSL